MAGLIGIAGTPEVALSAATVRTVVQLIAPANQRLIIKRWSVSFDGVSSTAEPVWVRLLRQTSAGTMSALTIVKNVAYPETLLATAQHTSTVSPTSGDVLQRVEVHPQGGGYEMVYPAGQEVQMSGGTRLGIECTAAAAVNVTATIVYEE